MKDKTDIAEKEEDQTPLTLEEAFAKLDETTRKLEMEDLPLEESFELYKSGMELLKQCSDSIDQDEKKVLALNSEGELNEF